ncbi:ABC transporter ATP-binding protein [Nocardioides sp.]|uniref:ABC transporter ATP-binding protein n=1 Tax=Nocardioides sp. TaxID=35761 RepID=UPI0039E69A72
MISTDVAPVVFDAVGKEFPNGVVALTDLSLTVRPGEFVSVVGPSGCGKSTLLQLAAGLTHPTSGYVEVPDALPGVVFQDANLLPWRSVHRNVELADALAGVPRGRRRQRAEAAIATVGLADFADQLPVRLSGGMRMRVAIARALVTDPGLLLFDEPFGALDEITRLTLQDELQRVVAARNAAAVFITHSVTEAVYLSTRVIVMSARPGRIVADIEVDAPRPRDHSFRYTPAFAELSARVSRALAEGQQA